MTPPELAEAASRLVADLMPIAVAVAGTGAREVVDALANAGTGAESFTPGMEPGFDLAILLADPDPAKEGVNALVTDLATVSDRLLFIPAPLGRAGPPNLDGWFEVLAEHGYQPVIDYDASFLGGGAFLVDRNATAAENDLSAFADRLSMGGQLAAATQRAAVLEAELGDAGDRAALKSRLTSLEGELSAVRAREAAWRDRAEQAERELAGANQQLAAWQGLGPWIAAASRAPGRQSLAALREAAGTVIRKRRLFFRKSALRPTEDEERLLADAALIRSHAAFDAPWYIASQPDLRDSGGDPVWHYMLRGAASGADPAPWFNSAAYVAAHPDAARNPLAHAIRAGHLDTARE